MKWLTLEYIKMHSRIDFNVSDAILEVYGNAAEDVVLNICNTSYDAMLAEYGDVPAPIMVASLQLVELSYTQRSPVTQANLSIVPYSFDLLVKPYMKLTSGGGMQSGALYDRDEQRYKFGQTGSEIQALLNKAADLPTREELDAMFDEKQDKPKPYFVLVNDGGNYLGFVHDGMTVLVGRPYANTAVQIWDVDENDWGVPFDSQAPALNPDGCTDESIGENIGASLTDGLLVYSYITGYVIEEDFTVGKVIACSSQDMVCEILYLEKVVDGWYFVIPKGQHPEIGRIRNFI